MSQGVWVRLTRVLSFFKCSRFGGSGNEHGNPMLYDSVAIKNLIEDMQRAPAIDHVIL